MKKTKAVILASGGIDSTVIAYMYAEKGYDLHLLGFDYGQRHAERELQALSDISKALPPSTTLEVVSLKGIIRFSDSALSPKGTDVPEGHYKDDSMLATVVPNRNSTMLTVATGIAIEQEANLVAIGIQGGRETIYSDSHPTYFRYMARALVSGVRGQAVKKFSIEAPLGLLSKKDIIDTGERLGVPFSLTYSCYKGGAIHCGCCGTCVKRAEAFLLAGITDPTEYADKEFVLAALKGQTDVRN